MAVINEDDVRVWLDSQKLSITTLDSNLAEQITAEVLGAVSSAYSVEGWTTVINTPLIVRRVISMMYAGYTFHKKYSPDTDPGTYGELLLANAKTLLDGIVSGNITVISTLAAPTLVASSGASIADELISSEPMFTIGMQW